MLYPETWFLIPEYTNITRIVTLFVKGSPLPPINRSNTALLLHDMQKDFLKDYRSRPELMACIKKTRELIDLAHSLHIPIIYTRVVNDPEFRYPKERAPYLFGGSTPTACLKGTEGTEFIEEVKPTSTDFVVTKVRSSAFYLTPLEAFLRTKNVWILVVAGGSVNWGVEWVARDATARDIVTVALRDCTYSGSPELHAASLANIDSFLGFVMNQPDVVKMLEKN